MSYEVGDTVLITSDLHVLETYERQQYLGAVMTIAEVVVNDFVYLESETWYEMVEDGRFWVWTDELILEKVVVQKKEAIKSTYLPII